MTKRLASVIALVACAVGLWYLRDPAWLASVESGFRGWEQDADGTRFRWIGGHASFFVPSGAAAIALPLRAPGSSDRPATVTISIDDRPADRLVVSDERWRELRVVLSGGTSRRVRRIDIRVDRTLRDNRGIQVGAWVLP
jgi:hypothetical protein